MRLAPSPWARILIFLLFGMALLALPSLTTNYTLRLVNNAGIYMLLVLGLNFILGFAGQLSFAQVGFFAIGAYVSALMTLDLGVPFFAGIGAAVLATGVCAIVLGMPTLKLRGYYLALATFAFAEIVRHVATNWSEVTRGAAGVVGIPPATIGTLTLVTDRQYYYLILVVVVLGYLVAVAVQNSKFGRSFEAIRESEVAAQAMGIHSPARKLLAFTLSGVYGGIAGSLHAHLFSVVSPDEFSFDVSIVVLVALLLGGSGSPLGAVVGAALMIALPEFLRFLQQYYQIVYGLGIVALMVFMPEGLIGLGRRLAAGGDWRGRE